MASTSTLLTGALFGAALAASPVHLPAMIRAQLSLASMYMMTTFLTASAISALVIYASKRSRYAALPCRTDASWGWFGAYDANVVGGLLQGLGMALTGACPGTGIVQTALGIPRAGWVVAGGVVGGLAFVILSPRLKRSVGAGSSAAPAVRGHTVMQRFKVSDEFAVLTYEALLIGTILAIDRLSGAALTTASSSHNRFWLPPVLGGCLIGIAQASSVLLSKKTLGVSSAYADIAAHIVSLLGGTTTSAGYSNILFVLGVGLGARLTAARLPAAAAGGEGMGASIPVALLGGFASIFGARMAGGCTSGHGISGISTLSVSSFVTIAAMFGGGIVVRVLLNRLGM